MKSVKVLILKNPILYQSYSFDFPFIQMCSLIPPELTTTQKWFFRSSLVKTMVLFRRTFNKPVDAQTILSQVKLFFSVVNFFLHERQWLNHLNILIVPCLVKQFFVNGSLKNCCNKWFYIAPKRVPELFTTLNQIQYTIDLIFPRLFC